MWKRKVYCATCDQQIDTIKTPDRHPNAISEAMILGGARHAHMKDLGCDGSGGSGWYFGDWKEVT